MKTSKENLNPVEQSKHHISCNFIHYHIIHIHFLVTWTAKESQSNQSLKSTKHVTVIVRRATGFYRHVKHLIWTSLQELSLEGQNHPHSWSICPVTGPKWNPWCQWSSRTPDCVSNSFLTDILPSLLKGCVEKLHIKWVHANQKKKCKTYHINIFFLSCSLRTGSDKKYQYI